MTDHANINGEGANASRKRKRSNVPQLPKKKSVACHKCHSRKVKCSGEKPCSNCVRLQCTAQCIYPVRSQKFTLTESDIEQLVAERINDQQKQNGTTQSLQSNSGNHAATQPSGPPAVSIETPGPSNTTSSERNPLLGDRSWFVPLKTVEMPIHIGEAADGAFATRFRQAISPAGAAQHIPRTQYVTDAKLVELADQDCVWPSLARAKLLIRVALDTIGRVHYCVRKSEIFEGLKQHYRNQPVPSTFFTCKLLALFALGEVFSSRIQCSNQNNFPGLAYFGRASRIMRGSSERPQMDTVECMLLLALYSLVLNRRHTAYSQATLAVRQSIIMGLHQNVPEALLPDRATREHRVRIWWTAYTLDRYVASKMGHPVSVQDDEMSIDLPSNEGLEEHRQDFPDAAYLNASIKLSQLAQKIISSIYGRQTTHVAFSRRVQKALRDLRSWVEELPKQVHIGTDDTAEMLTRPIRWLHLTFNQYVILATRPILLHILRTHTDLWSRPLKDVNLSQEIGETPLALAEACVRSARHSHRLLTESWINGSFDTFGYSNTQYLFAAATILAISSLSIGKDSEADGENFITACEWLQQLSQNGNFAATEFSQHLVAIKSAMAFLTADPKDSVSYGFSDAWTGSTFNPSIEPSPAASSGLQQMTTEMALAEPTLQDFLSRGDLDLSFLDTQMQDNQFQSLYFPLLPDEGWQVG